MGALVPLVGPLDERLFLAVNSLGDGPDWLFAIVDPHTRNYAVMGLVAVAAAALRDRRLALGMAGAAVFAAVLSDALMEAVQVVIDRPRPSEVLPGEALLTPGHDWAAIPSFPSGHLVVTTAIAATAASILPALRGPLWIWVGVIAFTRVLFGADFPLDVAVGLIFGYEAGRFSAALAHAVGVLPEAPASPALAGHARRWLEEARCRLLSSCGDGPLRQPSRVR